MDRGTAGSRRAGGLLALLALVLVLGGATTVLSLRALHLVAVLPTHRVEPWVELGAVSAGALAALWVALCALVGLAGVAAEAAGRAGAPGGGAGGRREAGGRAERAPGGWRRVREP